jgi:hypothetical protein
MRKFAFAKLLLASTAIVFGSLSIIPSVVHADPMPATAFIAPLQITPLCADAATNTAYWNVNNFNASAISFDWKNIDDGAQGNFTANSGVSKLATEFRTNQNNTTHFSYPGFDGQTNSSNTPCAPIVTPSTPPCVDGSNAANIDFSYVSPGDVTVHTKGNQLLCNDVHLYFSSYIMPSNYNGNGFYGNTTAYPQTVYASDDAVLTAGTDGTTELHIDLPGICDNVQTDLYYAPEITTVGPNGHGTQNIDSYVYLAESHNPACTYDGGGDGGGVVTPPIVTLTPTPPATPVTPVSPVKPSAPGGKGGGIAESVATPTIASTAPQLANTGQSLTFTSILAAILAASSVLVYFFGSKQVRRQVQ